MFFRGPVKLTFVSGSTFSFGGRAGEPLGVKFPFGHDVEEFETRSVRTWDVLFDYVDVFVSYWFEEVCLGDSFG